MPMQIDSVKLDKDEKFIFRGYMFKGGALEFKILRFGEIGDDEEWGIGEIAITNQNFHMIFFGTPDVYKIKHEKIKMVCQSSLERNTWVLMLNEPLSNNVSLFTFALRFVKKFKKAIQGYSWYDGNHVHNDVDNRNVIE